VGRGGGRLLDSRHRAGGHDGVEPVLLVDRGPLEDAPAALATFQPVEEARPRGHIDGDPVDRLPHQNHDTGLGDGAVAGDPHERRRDQMLGGTAAPAVLDEFAEWAAEPRYRDLARGMEGVEQLRPAALVAIKPPGLDQLGAGIFVFGRHRSFSCARSAPRIALARPARGDGPYLPEY